MHYSPIDAMQQCMLVHPLFKELLEKWELPPINEVTRKLERVNRAMKKQADELEKSKWAHGTPLLCHTWLKAVSPGWTIDLLKSNWDVVVCDALSLPSISCCVADMTSWKPLINSRKFSSLLRRVFGSSKMACNRAKTLTGVSAKGGAGEFQPPQLISVQLL